MQPIKWAHWSNWRDKQAAMAVVISLATYLYNSLLSSQNGFGSWQSPGPVVETNLGSVTGVYERSRDGSVFASFYGIPFAKPPVGELRFEVSWYFMITYFKIRHALGYRNRYRLILGLEYGMLQIMLPNACKLRQW